MTVPPSTPEGQRRHYRYFALLLVAVLLIAFLYMLWSIAAGIIAGVLLWVMTRGIYDWLLKRTGDRKGLSAGLSVLATLLLVIVPLAVVVATVTSDAVSLANTIQQWIPSIQSKLDEWSRLLGSNRLSLFGYHLSADQLLGPVGELSTKLGQLLFAVTQRTASSIMTIVIMLFVALYVLYFFYVDGDRFIKWLKEILPLDSRHSQQLVDSFFKSSVATLKMIGVIGVVQGTLAGIAYVIIGIPAPFFLTVLTIISTVIPTVGPGLIIIPVSIGLIIAGKIGWAIALLVWGALVIGNVDNILRPYLVHRAIQLHQLVLFVVMVGGIARFGFFGVLIGPVIAALLNASLRIYRDVYPRLTEPETAVEASGSPESPG